MGKNRERYSEKDKEDKKEGKKKTFGLLVDFICQPCFGYLTSNFVWVTQ